MNIGESNRHSQILIRKTPDLSPQYHPRPEKLPRVYIWEMKCGFCEHVYNVNNCDAWHRKCPNCQKGRPGIKVDYFDPLH